MKRMILSLILIATVWGLQAQNKSDVLVTIGNDTVTVDEFAKAYGKNNNLATATEKDLREYLDLFINFKMNPVLLW